MASEELELRQQNAKGKGEERTYEEFVEEQNIDDMNDYLEGVKAKLTTTSFLSEAKSNDQTTLRVPFGGTFADCTHFYRYSQREPSRSTLCLKEPPH